MAQTDTPCILLATLGGQPQIVTVALDLLLERSVPISDVIVVHPAAYPGVQEAFARLSAEFVGDRYQFQQRQLTIRLRRHILAWYDRPIADIMDDLAADNVLNDMDRLLRELKQQHHPIHFLISGGRRLISFLSFSAAILNFDPPDRLWHLYTPEAVRERAQHGAIMHVKPEDGVHLIEVPFARLSQPLLKKSLQDGQGDASTLIRSANSQREADERAKCKQVVDQLTLRQREVLQAFARGLDPQQVAQELNIALSTVSSHTNKPLALCREVWPDDPFRDYRSMRFRFAGYFREE